MERSTTILTVPRAAPAGLDERIWTPPVQVVVVSLISITCMSGSRIVIVKVVGASISCIASDNYPNMTPMALSSYDLIIYMDKYPMDLGITMAGENEYQSG